jgi:hypothetical protein
MIGWGVWRLRCVFGIMVEFVVMSEENEKEYSTEVGGNSPWYDKKLHGVTFLPSLHYGANELGKALHASNGIGEHEDDASTTAGGAVLYGPEQHPRHQNALGQQNPNMGRQAGNPPDVADDSPLWDISSASQAFLQAPVTTGSIPAMPADTLGPAYRSAPSGTSPEQGGRGAEASTSGSASGIGSVSLRSYGMEGSVISPDQGTVTASSALQGGSYQPLSTGGVAAYRTGQRTNNTTDDTPPPADDSGDTDAADDTPPPADDSDDTDAADDTPPPADDSDDTDAADDTPPPADDSGDADAADDTPPPADDSDDTDAADDTPPPADDSGDTDAADDTPPPVEEDIEGVNQSPSDIVVTGGTVAENAAAGTVVATLNTVDPDVGDIHQYEIANGDAMQFDGSGDYLSTALDVNESNYSTSITFATTEQDSSRLGLFSVNYKTHGTWGNDRHIYLDSEGNIATRVWRSGEGLGETISSSGVDYRDGDKHTVTHVLDGSNQIIYVDGIEVARGDYGYSEFGVQDNIEIGYGRDGGYFSGDIYDVKIYDKALDMGEITDTASFPLDDSLRAHYDFKGLDPLADKSGNGNDATAYGDAVSNNNISDLFEIVGDEIRVKEGAELDYETAASHNIAARTTDTGGETYEKTITISIEDEAEELVLTAGDDNFSDTGVPEISINAGSGNDSVAGFEGGDNFFIFEAGDGNDSFSGAEGSDWTDIIKVDAPEAYGGVIDWTLHVESGSIETEDENHMELSQDAAGSIDFADGSSIDFSNIEQIQW